MANLRPMLLIGLLVISYLMWVEWQKDYGVQPQEQASTKVDRSMQETQSLWKASWVVPFGQRVIPQNHPQSPTDGVTIRENNAYRSSR